MALFPLLSPWNNSALETQDPREWILEDAGTFQRVFDDEINETTRPVPWRQERMLRRQASRQVSDRTMRSLYQDKQLLQDQDFSGESVLDPDGDGDDDEVVMVQPWLMREDVDDEGVARSKRESKGKGKAKAYYMAGALRVDNDLTAAFGREDGMGFLSFDGYVSGDSATGAFFPGGSGYDPSSGPEVNGKMKGKDKQKARVRFAEEAKKFDGRSVKAIPRLKEKHVTRNPETGIASKVKNAVLRRSSRSERLSQQYSYKSFEGGDLGIARRPITGEFM